MNPEVVVVGQTARDLVLRVDRAPDAGTAAAVRSRDEVLGGKGANQAVGLAQLGTPVALLSVVGDDRAGHDLLAHAAADGIDVSHCVVRENARSALVVNVDDVDDDGGGATSRTSRPTSSSSKPTCSPRRTCCVRRPRWCSSSSNPHPLWWPPPAWPATAGRGWCSTVSRPDRDLLSRADVLRADAHEAEILTGRPVTEVAEGVKAGVMLLAHGLDLAVLEVAGHGNVCVSRAGYEFLPHATAPAVDTTGAGDALIATLTCALTRGHDLPTAARAAVAAAASTSEHAGGRPRLHPGILETRT